jgi:hypothetical protein
MVDVVYSVAVSLDGYVASADGSADWLAPLASGDDYVGAFVESVDVRLAASRPVQEAPIEDGERDFVRSTGASSEPRHAACRRRSTITGGLADHDGDLQHALSEFGLVDMAGAVGYHPRVERPPWRCIDLSSRLRRRDMKHGRGDRERKGVRLKTMTTHWCPWSMLRSVRIPSSYQLVAETPCLTWDFLIRPVRPEGLTPPSIFGAFALVQSGCAVIERCPDGSFHPQKPW